MCSVVRACVHACLCSVCVVCVTVCIVGIKDACGVASRFLMVGHSSIAIYTHRHSHVHVRHYQKKLHTRSITSCAIV